MKKIIQLCCVIPLLVACAPINTHFSCNATAGDRCLSIEEVNAMTEFKDSPALEPVMIKTSTCHHC